MTDVVTETTAAEPSEQVFAVKLKGDCGTIEVIGSKVHDNVYHSVFLAGLESIVNSVGMSKLLPGITKLEGKEKEAAVAAVLKRAHETVAELYKGVMSKKGRGAAVKTSGAVATEAMRLAKMLVKDHIRNSGQKIGAYTAKEITEAAKKVLEGNPRLVQQAEANLAERATEAKKTGGLDLVGLFGEKATSEEVKAKPKVPPKPKAKKEGEKKPLSAKQAALVAPRQKPSAAHTTAH